MADPSRAFIRALTGVWGQDYWVTWHPSSRLSLGAIGTVGHPGLVPIGELLDHGIVQPEVEPGGRDSLTWQTAGAVKVTHRAAAEAGEPTGALAAARAGTLVEFTHKNAVLVVYRGLSETRLADQPGLAKELIRRYWNGDWKTDWCVVSHLVTARSGTVLMSADKGATVELSASGSGTAGPVTLADLGTEVRATRSSALQCELVGRRMTPFYRVLRLRRRFIRGIEADYGQVRSTHRSPDRPRPVPPDLLEEVQDTPYEALELVPQPLAPPDEEATDADGA
ncbi:hypothetical protein [Streptomyces sp. NPDC086777]|uniref:hypothetical protein n=1 Tax=Streptomyces sp. NPDC086777 TaxID=3154866 RepID=UPI00344EE4E0